MKSRTFINSVLAALCALGLTSSAVAQAPDFNVDSFFDIHYVIEFSDFEPPPSLLECTICDPIRDMIQEKETELNKLREKGNKLLSELQNVITERTDAEKDLEDAKKELDDFLNPKSWAESEGNRVDSSDLRIMREHNQQLWEDYRNGDMTAQELEQAWKDGMTAAEKEKMREKIKKELEQKIKDVEKRVNDAKAKEKEIGGKLAALDAKVAALQNEIDALKKQYEECLRRCKAGEWVDLVQDFGLMPNPESPFDFFRWVRDFFVGLVGGEVDIDLGDTVDTEIVSLDLVGTDTIPQGWIPPPVQFPGEGDFPAESFFDVFVEIDVPDLSTLDMEIIECPECDPIFDKYMDKLKHYLDKKTEQDKLKAKAERLGKEIAQAQAKVDAAQAKLDAFTDPDSWAESGGRRIDSTDLEIIRAHNRSLWAQYRSGDLDADGLQEAWKKGLSDKERDKLRKEAQKALEKELKDAQKAHKELKKDGEDLEKDIKKLNDEISKMDKELDAIFKEYMDCLDRCKNKKDDECLEMTECKEMCVAEGVAGACRFLYSREDNVECFYCEMPVTISVCEAPYMDITLCEEVCGDFCLPYISASEAAPICYICEDTVRDPEVCPSPLVDKATCDSTCFQPKTCIWSMNTDDRKTECYSCLPPFKPVDDPCHGPLMTKENCDRVCKAPNSCIWSDNARSNREIGCYSCLAPFKPVTDPCPDPYMTSANCNTVCKEPNTCVSGTTMDDGTVCVSCEPPSDEPAQACTSPLMDKATCDSTCLQPNSCVFSTRTDDRKTACYSCLPPFKPVNDPCSDPYMTHQNCETVCKDPNRCITRTTMDDGTVCVSCEPPSDEIPPSECHGDLLTKAQCDSTCPSPSTCIFSDYSRHDRRVKCYSCVPPIDTPPPVECHGDLLTRAQCDATCESPSTCIFSDYARADRSVQCFSCVPPIDEPEECDYPAMEFGSCDSQCDGFCEETYRTDRGLRCYECVPLDDPPTTCDLPLTPLSECQSKCDGTCVFMYASDELDCYECVPDTGPECPSGTTPNIGTCEEQCPGDGVCIEDDGCFSCIVVNCPADSYRDAGDCQATCEGECTVVGSQYGVDCWGCQLSCDQTCVEYGYNVGDTDYTNEILSQLNQHSCVSGADISITTADIGSCYCTKNPVVTVDTTPPVCGGTPCGDVSCGESTECTVGDTHYTVNCNWGGWEQIAPNQFRPVIGQ